MIDAAMDVWNSPGVPSDYGCAQNALLRWIDYANGMHTGKRVVAVEHWMWLDLAFPESCQEDFESHFRMKGKQPAFLKANKVITDSSGEFEPGCVITQWRFPFARHSTKTHNLRILVAPPSPRRIVVDRINSEAPVPQ